MSQGDELFGQPRDDSFGAAIEFRGHRLGQWGNLCYAQALCLQVGDAADILQTLRQNFDRERFTESVRKCSGRLDAPTLPAEALESALVARGLSAGQTLTHFDPIAG
jgi:hypothetical protein